MKVNGEKSHERKARLRAEAEARQEKRNHRSSDEQIALLKNRMGNSVREIARLVWKQEQQVQKADAPTAVVEAVAEVVTAELAEKPHLKAKERRAKARHRDLE